MFTNLANELGHHLVASIRGQPKLSPRPQKCQADSGAQPPCVGKIFRCLELPKKNRVECVYASFLGRIM